MQRMLTARGHYRGQDRRQGRDEDARRARRLSEGNGLKVDCWPTAAVLAHMR